MSSCSAFYLSGWGDPNSENWKNLNDKLWAGGNSKICILKCQMELPEESGNYISQIYVNTDCYVMFKWY